jgi:ornithine cyclodeaminase/alanine dehydrogenase-like protein (mu-crystallin family)
LELRKCLPLSGRGDHFGGRKQLGLPALTELPQRVVEAPREDVRRARILADDIEACASGGDLNHALRAGAVTKDQVYADLADLAAGRKQGRMTAQELVIFDSSGSGMQDIAAAWAAYREASRTGAGVRFDLSGGSASS